MPGHRKKGGGGAFGAVFRVVDAIRGPEETRPIHRAHRQVEYEREQRLRAKVNREFNREQKEAAAKLIKSFWKERCTQCRQHCATKCQGCGLQLCIPCGTLHRCGRGR